MSCTQNLGMISVFRKAVSASGLLLVMACAGISAQGATVVNFGWTGNGGYTATGSFAYDPTMTPTSFSEKPGAGPTSYLQSFNISFFSPQNALLETGSSIVNSVSSDRFFRLDFNSQTNLISSLDGDVGGSNYQYFLTNLRTPGGQVVAPGATTFNLFVRTSGTPNLDIASSVQVTSVSQTPEPSTSGLLGIAGAGLGFFLVRRKAARLSV